MSARTHSYSKLCFGFLIFSVLFLFFSAFFLLLLWFTFNFQQQRTTNENENKLEDNAPRVLFWLCSFTHIHSLTRSLARSFNRLLGSYIFFLLRVQPMRTKRMCEISAFTVFIYYFCEYVHWFLVRIFFTSQNLTNENFVKTYTPIK